MSSPVNDEHHDKRYMYAPPWARETAKEPPEAIVEAIEQLRLERRRGTAAPGDAANKPRESGEGASTPSPAASDTADLETAMADVIRASKWTPHSLDPVAMPEPPKPRLDGPTWGMVVRLGGAVTAAAIVALFVGGAVRLPAIDISLGARESAQAGPAVAQVPVTGDFRPQRQPIVVADASPSLPPDTATAAPMPATPVRPVVIPQASAAPPNTLPSDVLTAYASLDTQPPGTSLKPKGDAAQVAATAAPKLGELRALDRDELAGLVKRGQALLNEGDIASARLLLRRAAEAGDANAALLLAASYDRAELAKLKVIGVAADHAQAKLWYTKAVEHGSAEAVRRLQQLAQRAE